MHFKGKDRITKTKEHIHPINIFNFNFTSLKRMTCDKIVTVIKLV